MKSIKLLLGFLFVISIVNMAVAQCTPGDEESCPDPENNGQVCPDSLPDAAINNLYTEEFTIVSPPYYITETNDTIELHHIQLMDIGNLPEGFSWVSNSPDSVFIPGEYYCVLIDGTPTTYGLYDLRITVDIYVEVVPGYPPVKVATRIDSTSLSIMVGWDPNSIDPAVGNDFRFFGNNPNPYQDRTKLGFFTARNGLFELNIYNLIGNLVYTEKIAATVGDNYFRFNGNTLRDGMYISILSGNQQSVSRRMIRAR